MVYGYRGLLVSHMSVEGALQDPSQWFANEVSGIGGEYGGPMGPAVLNSVV